MCNYPEPDAYISTFNDSLLAEEAIKLYKMRDLSK